MVGAITPTKRSPASYDRILYLSGQATSGMHGMDEDFAVFAILPPFNTLNAQLVDLSGNLRTGTRGTQLALPSDGTAPTAVCAAESRFDKRVEILSTNGFHHILTFP